MDGIGLVLEKIGARFAAQEIFGHESEASPDGWFNALN